MQRAAHAGCGGENWSCVSQGSCSLSSAPASLGGGSWAQAPSTVVHSGTQGKLRCRTQERKPVSVAMSAPRQPLAPEPLRPGAWEDGQEYQERLQLKGLQNTRAKEPGARRAFHIQYPGTFFICTEKRVAPSAHLSPLYFWERI